MVIALHNIATPIEWQCAHAAVTHADRKQDITLHYETPEGDLALTVEMHQGTIHVFKED